MKEDQILKHSYSAKALKEELASIPDDWTIIFAVYGTPISLQRFKIRGEKLTQMEFGSVPGFSLKDTPS